MLSAAITFFVIAILAYILGASGLAGLTIGIGKTLLVVFLILSVLSFLFGMITGKKPNIT